MKTKNIFIILGIVAVILIGVVLFFSQGFLNIMVGGRPPEVKNEVWKGIDVKLTAPIFGSVSNTAGYEFCGSNDGDNVLSDSYLVTDRLSLGSSMADGGRPGRHCSGNYIMAEFEIPPGKLTGICSLGVSSPYDGVSASSCSIGNLFSSSLSINEIQQREGLPTSKSESFELVFDEPTNIKVRLNTGKGYTGSASANIQLNFQVECTSDSNCLGDSYIGEKYCSDSNLVQKYRDYSCINYQCKYSDTEKIIKTCTFGCEDGECLTVAPPEPKPIVIQFFIDIWESINDWFKNIFGG